jgi:hypothetical protein
VENRLRTRITFPCANQVKPPGSVFSTAVYSNSAESSETSLFEDEDADNNPYPPFDSDRPVLFGRRYQNSSGSKTWSSRPTTPSKTSFDQRGEETEINLVYGDLEQQYKEHPLRSCDERQPVLWSIDEVDTPIISAETKIHIGVEISDPDHHHLWGTKLNPRILSIPDVPPTKITFAPSSIGFKTRRDCQRSLTFEEKREALDVRRAKAY